MSMFLRRVFKKLRPRSLEAASISTRVVGPAIDVAPRPGFYLPGEFEAVIRCVNNDLELERRRVTGATQHHLPTIEYTLKNAHLSGEFLYAGSYFERFGTNRPYGKGEVLATIDHMEEALFSTNGLSGREFGHWVRDSLVTEMHGVNERIRSVALSRKPWQHEAEFRAIAGLSCAYPATCRVDRLTLLDDRGHNNYWKSRLLALRARMKAASSIDQVGASAGERVFLSRGMDGRVREPSNIEAIEDDLRAMGFQSINPSAMSVQGVASALRDVKIAVATEGSNLNHLHYFAPDGLALVCMQDPRRFYAYHKSIMDSYDGRFGFVVGRPDTDLPGRHRISVDSIKRTIDLLG